MVFLHNFRQHIPSSVEFFIIGCGLFIGIMPDLNQKEISFRKLIVKRILRPVTFAKVIFSILWIVVVRIFAL
jgi:hypothetical protein